MASRLPAISRDHFEEGLAALSPEVLPAGAMQALYTHYVELARWNERLGLIGPGTTDEVLVRHYGESLAALQLIPRSARSGVDLGSGAGFPGIVLAAALPELRMTLVEARERKWSFLATVAWKASLSCRCLNVRVASPLPAGLPVRFDLVTVRALRLETDVLAALARRLTPDGSVLLWAGERDPELPRELVLQASVRLAGGERRRILRLRVATRSPMAENAARRGPCPSRESEGA
jgi:16S rRNA (guanine527-N7)-methyltransferase